MIIYMLLIILSCASTVLQAVTQAEALATLKFDNTSTLPTSDEVKEHYRKLIIKYHPDKSTLDMAKATIDAQKINEARDYLIELIDSENRRSKSQSTNTSSTAPTQRTAPSQQQRLHPNIPLFPATPEGKNKLLWEASSIPHAKELIYQDNSAHLLKFDDGLSLMKALLETYKVPANAGLNDERPRQETPLHLAAKSQSTEAVKLLLSHKANPKARIVGSGRTPLHYAMYNRVPPAALVRALLDSGADVNALDIGERSTPLYELLAFTSYKDPNAEDQFKNFDETVTLLLDRGAKVGLKTSDNETAYTAAAKKLAGINDPRAQKLFLRIAKASATENKDINPDDYREKRADDDFVLID